MTTTVPETDKEQVRHDWARGYESQPEEFSYWIDDVEGSIPPELQGTLYRNGPGLLDINGIPIHHPFDGDGMVNAFAFKDGRAYFRSRYVRTEGYVAEQEAGTVLYRGVFGTQKPGGWLRNAFDLKLKNVGNTNVLHWGDKLLALWEAGEPHRLDPKSLETLGLDHLNGLLRSGEAFASHFHIDPASHWDDGRPCLVNFGMQPGPSTTMNIFEFGPDWKVLRRQSLRLSGFSLIHDIAITPNYVICFQNPVEYNPLPYAIGQRAAGQCLRSVPGRPSRINVIPRHPSLGSRRSFETENGFVWHHANAFEDGDDLVIDSVWYDSYAGIEPDTDFRRIDFDHLPTGRLMRTRINLVTGEAGRTLINERNCEFPVLHPALVGRKYRYTYLAASRRPQGNAPLQAIMKVDMENGDSWVWSPGPHSFADEPIFVPRPKSPDLAGKISPDTGDPAANSADGEDNGWLLTLVYDAERHANELVIHDAADIEGGPLARLRLRHHIPHGLHGSFTSRYYGAEETSTP
jgi:all-trans-8'-apo-beta-carotenal 15,15'-oxygenase